MYINAKILKNILVRRILQHIKWNIHHVQVGFTSGMPREFNISISTSVICHINRMENKNYMIILIDVGKALKKICFVIKTLKKLGTQGTYLNIIKAIYDMSIANVMLQGKRLKAFPLG